MQFALNPETHRPMSPEAFSVWKKFHDCQYAICGACKARAFDHSVGSVKVMAHFNHEKNSGPCKLKGAPSIKDGSDYSGDGEALRAQFFHPDYIQLAFSACQAMVCGYLPGDNFIIVADNFTPFRFVELLNIADTKRTWFLKGLTPLLMPFELLSSEVFDAKHGGPSTKDSAFTFFLDKHPLVTLGEPFDRNITVDSTKPIHLVKFFVEQNGNLGSRVDGRFDSRNPYLVSEENALELAKPKWDKLPDYWVKSILDKFRR